MPAGGFARYENFTGWDAKWLQVRSRYYANYVYISETFALTSAKAKHSRAPKRIATPSVENGSEPCRLQRRTVWNRAQAVSTTTKNHAFQSLLVTIATPTGAMRA